MLVLHGDPPVKTALDSFLASMAWGLGASALIGLLTWGCWTIPTRLFRGLQNRLHLLAEGLPPSAPSASTLFREFRDLHDAVGRCASAMNASRGSVDQSRLAWEESLARHLQALVDLMPETGILIFDSHNRLKHWNPSAERHFPTPLLRHAHVIECLKDGRLLELLSLTAANRNHSLEGSWEHGKALAFNVANEDGSTGFTYLVLLKPS